MGKKRKTGKMGKKGAHRGRARKRVMKVSVLNRPDVAKLTEKIGSVETELQGEKGEERIK